MRFALAQVRPPGLLTALALAAALDGCSLAPRYERPASPVAAAYPTGEAYGSAASDASPAAADIGWRDFFRDPLLRQLIEVALHNNRDLRQAALKVEAAQALYRIQRAELAPSLALAGQASVERLPADLRAAREAGIERRYEVGGAAATWELDLWGRIRSLNDQALAAYLALAETRHAAQMSLVSEVATVYLALRADQELLGLADATLEAQRRSYELTGHLLGAGHATRLDLRLAETALRDAEASRAASLRQAARRRNALVLLLGQALTPEQSRRLDAAAVLSDDVIPGDLPGGLPSDLLARRPTSGPPSRCCAAPMPISARRARLFFPAIHLTASAGTASASLGELFEAGSGAWRFARGCLCRCFKAAPCGRPWTPRTCRSASRSPVMSRPCRRPSGTWPMGWPASAPSMSRSVPNGCPWPPAAMPARWRPCASSWARMATLPCWRRIATCTPRSAAWSPRAWRA